MALSTGCYGCAVYLFLSIHAFLYLLFFAQTLDVLSYGRDLLLLSMAIYQVSTGAATAAHRRNGDLCDILAVESKSDDQPADSHLRISTNSLDETLQVRWQFCA